MNIFTKYFEWILFLLLILALLLLMAFAHEKRIIILEEKINKMENIVYEYKNDNRK